MALGGKGIPIIGRVKTEEADPDVLIMALRRQFGPRDLAAAIMRHKLVDLQIMIGAVRGMLLNQGIKEIVLHQPDEPGGDGKGTA
jgi:hypothetical protein